MAEAKKTRGVWIIHVKGSDSKQCADMGHDKCNQTPSEGVSHYDEQEKNKKEE